MEKSSETVKSKLFQESDFFKSNDRGQVKYEMLRAHCHEGHFITSVSLLSVSSQIGVTS